MTSAQKAFTQYISLFKESDFRGAASPVPGALNRSAAGALDKALAEWRPDPMGVAETSAPALFAPDYGVNTLGVRLPVDAAASFRCGVPRLNSLLGIVANDAYYPTQNMASALPEGLTVCSLRNVPADISPRVSEVLSRHLSDGGPAAALNSLFLHDGVLVYARRGVKVDKAVQIVNITSVAMPVLNFRRVVVVAEEDAEVKVLLCDHSQTDRVETLDSEVVCVEVDERARVELYDVEETLPSSRRHWQLFAHQASHSHLSIGSFALHGGRTRNEYRVYVDGDYAHTSLSGLSICSADRIVDNDVLLTHSGVHCTSRQLFKNALFDESKGGFSGKIVVKHGAMFTDAEQTNRNIVDGDAARMTTAPQLEIYCDEVKCSHGATTGQLDERALFYMQARGIPADEARRMLTQAFMSDVIDSISFEVLRQRLHVLVEKRLSGAAAGCDTCATACHSDKPEEL
ncbi:MAG: SufD family Fe-S cluster assembly protein [Muribaculaceae bacterium]|nr:SufD family Fe-S cluster assembly protein [Muribaculaceae bacterium]